MQRPWEGKTPWFGGALAILVLGVVLGVFWGWPALAGAALAATLFGSGPTWWRYLEERADKQDRTPARLNAIEPADAHRSAPPSPMPSPSGRVGAATPTDIPAWTPELLHIADLLPEVLPSPTDIDQVASESRIATHAYATSGDKAANRWHGLVDYARLRGYERLDFLLQRAAQRSQQDPRLVPAIDRWRHSER